MIALALVSIALFAQRSAAPGPVVLLGGRVQESAIAELAKTPEPRVELKLRAGEAEPLPLGVLDPKARFPADAPELERAVRASARIDFGAGALADWLDVLYPRRHDSALVRALFDAHRAGATITGRGEGACVLSAAAVAPNVAAMRATSSDLHDAALPIAVWPVAMQPWALLDEEQRASGSFERLAVVLEREKLPLGVFLGADAALVVRRESETLEARGPGVSLVIDLRGAQRSPGRLRDARVSLLGDGDRWLAARRDAVLAGEVPASATGKAPARVRCASALRLAALADALAAAPLDAPSIVVEGEDGSRVELALDELSTVATDAAGRRRWAETLAVLSWRSPSARDPNQR